MYRRLGYRSTASYKTLVLILSVVCTAILTVALLNYNGRKSSGNILPATTVNIVKSMGNGEVKCGNKIKKTDKSDLAIPDWERDLDFTDFNNETGTEDGHYIVPNYVHFLRFGNDELSFDHMICILSAFKHQRPDKLFLHTDNDKLEGKYWEVLKNTPGFMKVLVIEKMALPTEIFCQKLNQGWAKFHGGDVARLQVMMKYGGIYLDNDSYLIRSVNDLRRYEMVVGWRPGETMGNQIFVAHKSARYLKLWLDTYHVYDPSKWYYNAAERPTQLILNFQPHLVHRVPSDMLGVYMSVYKLYVDRWPDWREYYSVHLLSRHQYILKKNISAVATFPVVFNETNIKLYPNTYRDMVNDVFDIGIGSK